MTEPCVFFVQLEPGLIGSVLCGEPSAGVLRAVCVHEHVSGLRPVCPACAVDVQHLAGTIACGPCLRAGDKAHECLLRVVIEWYEGYQEPESVTVVQEAA